MTKQKVNDAKKEHRRFDPDGSADIEKLVETLTRERQNFPGGKSQIPVSLDNEMKSLVEEILKHLKTLTGHKQLAAGKILRIAALEWLVETRDALREVVNRNKLKE